MKKVIISFVICSFSLSTNAGGIAENECNENFQDIYTAKKSCILNNSQSECTKLGILSSLYPLAGGAAGAFAAKMWSDRLDRRSDVPNPKVLLEKIRAVNEAYNIANKIMDDMDLKKQNFVESVQEAIKKTNNPLVAEILEEIGLGTRPYKRSFSRVLQEHFGKDSDRIVEIYKANQGLRGEDYKKLNSKEKIIYDLYGSVARNDPQELGLERVKRAANEQEKKSGSRLVKGAVLGTAMGGVAPIGIQVGANFLDKKNIELCQKELGLSENDVAILNGNSYWFSSANAKSSGGLIRFTCGQLKLQNTAETIAQIKLNNNGKISPGICKIMKNEMSELDGVFESIVSVRNIDCKGFKAANLEVSFNDPKTFTYSLEPETNLTAPIGKNGQPDFSQAIVLQNGKEDISKTTEFRQKNDSSMANYFLGSSAVEVKKNATCLDASDSTLNCKLRRAALAVRMFHQSYEESCANQENTGAKKNEPAEANR